MQLKLMLSLVAFSVCVSSSQGIVLENEYKELRTVCGKKEVITPLKESIARGKCEKFAESTGGIAVGIYHEKSRRFDTSAQGTGILILPDVILTAAHVVREIVKNDQNGMFHEDKYTGDYFVFDKSNVVICPSGDLALIFLRKNAAGKDIKLLKISTEKPEESERGFAISYNQIKDNETGKPFQTEFLRHFMVARVKYGPIVQGESQLGFTQILSLPRDYGKTCRLRIQEMITEKVPKKGALEKIMKDENTPIIVKDMWRIGIEPDRFFYGHKNSTDTETPFLEGMLQQGDSGGPLVMLKNKEMKIVGIAKDVRSVHCSDEEVESKTKTRLPQFRQTWEPLYPHLKWLKETLLKEKVNLKDYQQDLNDFVIN